MRPLCLFYALAVTAGCSAAWRAPNVPRTYSREPVAFTDASALRAFLADIASTRPARRTLSLVISEHDGEWTSVHVEPRVTPRLTATLAATVGSARPMLESGGAIWVARPRTITRLTQASGALVAEAIAPLPDGTRSIEPNGLIALDDAVAAIMSNDCGGFTVARYRSTGSPPTLDGTLRLCGKLVSQPWAARVGQDVLAYAAFEPIEEESGKVTLPTVQRAGAAARSLPELGSVYYPVLRTADVLMRTLVRCDTALGVCSVRTLVSPRSHIDVLWADEERVGIAVTDRSESTVYLLPRAPGALRYANAPGWAFGLSRLSDGRLALLRSSQRMDWPGTRARPSVVAIDDRGEVTDGVELPAPVTGENGRWMWAVHADRLVYGPSRVRHMGGADTPRAFVAALPDGPVETQPIAPSVDAVFFVGDEVVLVGADGAGTGIILRRPLAEPGPWRHHPHTPKWSPEGFGFERAESTMLVELGRRRLLIVPYGDYSHRARYQMRVLELVADGFIDRGSFQRSTPPPDVSDDRFAAVAWEGRLLLRLPNEVVVVELDDEGAREAARLQM